MPPIRQPRAPHQKVEAILLQPKQPGLGILLRPKLSDRPMPPPRLHPRPARSPATIARGTPARKAIAVRHLLRLPGAAIGVCSFTMPPPLKNSLAVQPAPRRRKL